MEKLNAKQKLLNWMKSWKFRPSPKKPYIKKTPTRINYRIPDNYTEPELIDGHSKKWLDRQREKGRIEK